MGLPGGQLRGRVVKKFNNLGPYLREEQCSDQKFFFDCLAVCTNIKPPAEKREFWGWWLIVEALEDRYQYSYWFGLYDKQGEWIEGAVKKSAMTEVQRSLQQFYPRLEAVIAELDAEITVKVGFESLAS